jgi:hypothetical protein
MLSPLQSGKPRATWSPKLRLVPLWTLHEPL